MSTQFGENIKYLRLRDKLTQTEFGKKFGKSMQCVSAWEKGLRTPITKDVLEIAEHYKLLPMDLYLKDVRELEDNRQVVELYSRLKPNQKLTVLNLITELLGD